MGVKRQACVLLAPSDTSRTIPPQDSAAIAWASLPSQVLPPSPTQATSAVLLIHWSQSPSSPRRSPPQHCYAQALHNDTTGNGPTSQTLASNVPSQISPLVPAKLLKAPGTALHPMGTSVHQPTILSTLIIQTRQSSPSTILPISQTPSPPCSSLLPGPH